MRGSGDRFPHFFIVLEALMKTVAAKEFKNNNIIDKLNIVHQQLQNKFKYKSSEEKIARELEEFMNYIIYENNTLNNKNRFAQGMTDELKNQLRETAPIKKLNIRTRDSIGRLRLSGAAGEEAVSFLVLQAIKNMEQDESVKAEIEKIIQTNANALVTGIMQASPVSRDVSHAVLKKAREHVAVEGKKNLAYYFWNTTYGAFALKPGKIDIAANQLLITSEINFSPQTLKMLQILTASVKNYSSSRIHLETVNKKKSYQGIMATLYPSLPTKTVNKIYSDYYELRESEYQPALNHHFLHVINLYALTGTGQTYFDKINNQAIEYKLGAKFIIINQPKQGHIYVIPSSSIVSNFDNHNHIFSYGRSGQIEALWSDNHKTISVNLELENYRKLNLTN